ncbi:MAG: serine protease, partial [Clostridia bacterium]
MKKNKLIMVVLLLVVSCVSVLALTGCALFEPSPAPPTKPNVSINVDNLKDQSLSSVVANNTMTAVVKVYCEWSGSKSAGAGFVMNKDGYVVTNAHCILKENVKELDPRAKLSVEFVDGSRLEMSAVKYNPILDIAILKPKKAVKTPFEFLTFADTSTVVFGQQAYTW